MLSSPCFVSGIPQNLYFDLAGWRFPFDNRLWDASGVWPGTFPFGWSTMAAFTEPLSGDMIFAQVSWIRATGPGGCREYLRVQPEPSDPNSYGIYVNSLLPWTTYQHGDSAFTVDYNSPEFGRTIGQGVIHFPA